MRMEQLAEIVADYFVECMQDNDFATFQEMQACYWWTTNDIKDEVDTVLRDATDSLAYIDELDRSDVFNETEGKQESVTYKQFSQMYRIMIRRKMA